jgi:beta-galactosidase
LWRQSFNHKEDIDRARYFHAIQKTYAVEVEKGDSVKITADVSFAAAAMPPALKAKAVYEFFSDGRVEISFEGDVTHNAQPLPRFGIKMSLKKDFEDVQYYGYGPKESYSDRYKAMHLSRFNSTVTDEYENYVNPRECGAHYKTKYAELSNSDGMKLRIWDKSDEGFSFKALHFSDVQMDTVKHHDELVELDETIVNIDYKYHAENQGLTYLEPERAFTEKHFSFSYIVKPE